MAKRKDMWIANYFSMLSLLCIFLLGALILANVGVQVYKNIVEGNSENFRLRTSLSYVSTKVHQHDTIGGIAVQEKDGVPMLILKEDMGGSVYDTMVYCYEGSMRELLIEDGLEYKLEDGTEITKLDELQIVKEQDLLQVTAVYQGQEEQVSLYLRSMQGE